MGKENLGSTQSLKSAESSNWETNPALHRLATMSAILNRLSSTAWSESQRVQAKTQLNRLAARLLVSSSRRGLTAIDNKLGTLERSDSPDEKGLGAALRRTFTETVLAIIAEKGPDALQFAEQHLAARRS